MDKQLFEAPKLEDLTAQNSQEKSIRKRYPEFHEYVLETWPGNDLRWPEKLYLYYHPGETRQGCLVCGKPTKFGNIREGWKKCCSMRCAGRSPEMLAKRAETNKKRYGVENPFASKKIQKKIKATNLEKYGFENPNQAPEVLAKRAATNLERYGAEVVTKNKDIQEKIKKTNLERYGVETPLASAELRAKGIETCREKYGTDHPMQSTEIQDKVRATNLERYGYEVSSQAPETKEKAKQTNIDRYGCECPIREQKFARVIAENPEVISIRTDDTTKDIIYTCRCSHPGTCTKCTEKVYEITSNLYWNRKNSGTEPCTTLLPRGSASASTLEIKVREWLDELGIEYITNTRSIIPPHEIDIYIPSHQIGIEVNGCYWHSDLVRTNPDYHINKFRDAQEAGIRLYQIWEDWLVHKPDIIKSMLTNWLGLNEHHLGARECVLKEVGSDEAKEFLDRNHIQGSTRASVVLGLYTDSGAGDLVSLMTFSKARFVGGKDSWELVRFCSHQGTSVVGGASRLLKHFIRTYQPGSIYSYSSCDISAGDLYKSLGFTSSGKISTSYWYIRPETFERFHRSSFTKSAIVARGWKDRVDSSWTEKEVMDQRGFIRIYDGGTIRWDLKVQ